MTDTAPCPREPVQRPGEDWITFSHRWDASRFGAIRRAQADRLNAALRAFHAAEKAGKYPADPF